MIQRLWKRGYQNIVALIIIGIGLAIVYLYVFDDQVPSSPSPPILLTAEYLEQNPLPTPEYIMESALSVYRVEIDDEELCLNVAPYAITQTLYEGSGDGYRFRINARSRSWFRHNWNTYGGRVCADISDLDRGIHLGEFEILEADQVIDSYQFSFRN